jgi:endonuclease G
LLRVETAGFTLPDPFELADAEAEKGHLVALIGYPAYDSRNDDGDQSRYFSDLYEVKRFAPGLITQGLAAGAQLQHDCTSLGGNSGSPVLSLEHGRVVGLHFSGKYGKYNAAVGVATLKALLAGQSVSVGDQLAAPPESRADGHHDARLFKGRKGFDPKFLGKPRTPWPRLPTSLAAGLGKPSDKPREPNELRYTHFGVKYSTALKLPLMSAVNIDGQHSVRIKRGDDKWFTDGRLAAGGPAAGRQLCRRADRPRPHGARRGSQLGPARRRGGRNGRRRRHLPLRQCLRPAFDAEPGQEAVAGARELHPRQRPHPRLQGLRVHRAGAPAGGFGRGQDNDPDGAIVPLGYGWWRFDAARKATRPPYLLSQGQLVRDLLLRRSRHEALEGFELGAYRTFQISVKDLAEATGYDFATYADADPLARTGAGTEAIDSCEPLVIPLDEPENIIL